MSKAMSRVGYALVVAVLLGGLALVPPVQSRVGAPQGQQQTSHHGRVVELATDPFSKELIADLTESGFRVSQGYPMLYPKEACDAYTYPLLKNCYGNNPAAPYVIPVVKTWPDEYIDPATVNAFGETADGYSSTYRLDRREAIVIYGQLPPPGKYMGLQTFLFTQDGRWTFKDYDHWAHMPDLVVPIQYLFQKVPPDDTKSRRIQSLSALSNVINNVVIERQSGAAFGERRYFIITADAKMDQAVRHTLQGLGVPDSHVFTEPIPRRDEFGALGPLGLGKHANDFWTAIRYAIPDPDYEEAAQEWRSELPLTVLRVRGSRGAAEPYPLLPFDPRTAVNEEGLADDLQRLVNAVCDRASAAPWNLAGSGCEDPPPYESIMKDLVSDYGWVGPYCRDIGMNCLGDQQEASYFLASPRPLDSGEVYAIVSTLATETGNATYTALSVNDASRFKGAANILDRDLEGSARRYAATVKNHDKFFVHYFTRDCKAIQRLTGKACTEITEEMVPRHDDPTAQGDPALLGMFMVVVRNYIRPDTARGPDATK